MSAMTPEQFASGISFGEVESMGTSTREKKKLSSRTYSTERVIPRYKLYPFAEKGLSVLVAPLAAEAQQATHVYRIGWLSPGVPRPDHNPPVDAFRQGLRAFGYVEGQNLVMAYRGAEGKIERLADLAAELVQLQVAVIVAVGTAATHAAQGATHTIPIVMTGTSDPVAQGFVASLARPQTASEHYLPPWGIKPTVLEQRNLLD